MDQDAGRRLAQLFRTGGGVRQKSEFEVKIKNRLFFWFRYTNPQHKLAYLAQKVLASPAVAVGIDRNFKNCSNIDV